MSPDRTMLFGPTIRFDRTTLRHGLALLLVASLLASGGNLAAMAGGRSLQPSASGHASHSSQAADETTRLTAPTQPEPGPFVKETEQREAAPSRIELVDDRLQRPRSALRAFQRTADAGLLWIRTAHHSLHVLQVRLQV